jgi:hypothetical protein
MKEWFDSILATAKSWLSDQLKDAPAKMFVTASAEINSWDNLREPMKQKIREKGEAAADDAVDMMQAKAMDLAKKLIRKVFPNWSPEGPRPLQ